MSRGGEAIISSFNEPKSSVGMTIFGLDIRKHIHCRTSFYKIIKLTKEIFFSVFLFFGSFLI
jgi:hypothetical protein